MITLNEFLQQIEEQRHAENITDILTLLEPFEDLTVSNWEEVLEQENGEPVNTILYQSDDVKLVMIYWREGQQSSVHGHPGGGGLIKVLSGCLEETRYEPGSDDKVIDHHRLPVGSMGYIHDVLAYHRVSNPMGEPAVSLHVYSLAQAS